MRGILRMTVNHSIAVINRNVNKMWIKYSGSTNCKTSLTHLHNQFSEFSIVIYVNYILSFSVNTEYKEHENG